MIEETKDLQSYFEHINPSSGETEKSVFSFGGALERPKPNKPVPRKKSRRKTVQHTGSTEMPDYIV